MKNTKEDIKRGILNAKNKKSSFKEGTMDNSVKINRKEQGIKTGSENGISTEKTTAG